MMILSGTFISLVKDGIKEDDEIRVINIQEPLVNSINNHKIETENSLLDIILSINLKYRILGLCMFRRLLS